MEQHIRANAELVRRVAREELGETVDYDEAGVRWLDEYLNTQREVAVADVKERLPNTLGAFLGECIRQQYGGLWLNDPAMGWAVKISERLTVNPFGKVQKQLTSAEGESVLSFFGTIKILQAQSVAPARRWWQFW
ncbi:MAG TPA: hypothetical protein VEK11_17120 [Thermoanaerobaculia bacterium]|nr:hypothetical protein [Thermoanaerobaculia bacterium]